MESVSTSNASLYKMTPKTIQAEIISINSYYVKTDTISSIIMKIRDCDTRMCYDVRDRPYCLCDRFGRYEKDLSDKYLPEMKVFSDKELLYYLQSCIYFPHTFYTISFLEYNQGDSVKYYITGIQEIKDTKN